MKYVEASKFGGPEVLTVKEKETPKPGEGMLLVEVRAAGVNYADVAARLGSFPAIAKAPFLPGFEIAGVVRDARYFTNGLDQPTGPMYFTLEAQADYTRIAGALFLHDIVVAAKPGENVSATAVLQAMASVDPSLPIISSRTLKEKVATLLKQQQLIARLTSLFGVLSLVLASIGLYTMSDAVRARLACAWPWR